jgi:hypothetical protein
MLSDVQPHLEGLQTAWPELGKPCGVVHADLTHRA